METLRYESVGQMCRRRRDLGVTNVQALVKDRSVYKTGEPAMIAAVCYQLLSLSLKK